MAALSQPSTGQDRLPDYIDGVYPGSARLAAVQDGYTFYFAKPAEGEEAGTGVCVVVDNSADESGWLTACSSGPAHEGVLVGGAIRGIEAEVVADGYDASSKVASGWRQLHENLLVLGL